MGFTINAFHFCGAATLLAFSRAVASATFPVTDPRTVEPVPCAVTHIAFAASIASGTWNLQGSVAMGAYTVAAALIALTGCTAFFTLPVAAALGTQTAALAATGFAFSGILAALSTYRLSLTFGANRLAVAIGTQSFATAIGTHWLFRRGGGGICVILGLGLGRRRYTACAEGAGYFTKRNRITASYGDSCCARSNCGDHATGIYICYLSVAGLECQSVCGVCGGFGNDQSFGLARLC